jgi:4-aminobutyrate aminotransferase/4-aminobutyrate aminotransferase/(S)-3-amino-2-methylpropionate transaminase
MVYEKAFAKGLAWITAGNILRLAPPLTITEELAKTAINIIDEAITETERHFAIS